MKVLWVCNIMLPAAARQLGLPYSNKEGWITGLYEGILSGHKEKQEPEIELGICFPVGDRELTGLPAGGYWKQDNVSFYGFYEDTGNPHLETEGLREALQNILDDFKPDLVHLFGTEYAHGLAMVQAYNRPERTLAGIQGLCYACAEAYLANLPESVCRKTTLRDFLRKDNLLKQQEKFRIRGEREKQLLKQVGHITGRTEFDRKHTELIHKGRARYHKMNETMRKPFYSGNWKEERLERHRIFLSQGDYPLKGFHYLLRAMPCLLKQYPDASLYVAGADLTDLNTLSKRLKLSSYGAYLRALIQKLKLEDKVHMLGRLEVEQMKEQYLQSSVTVCCSALENSPNSLGEAMLLGVPVVAAAVGGIPSMVTDGIDGRLYKPGDPEELYKAVAAAFGEKEKTFAMARTARDRAWKVHDGEENLKRLMEIYREILCQ